MLICIFLYQPSPSFSVVCLTTHTFSVEGFAIGPDTAPRVSLHLLNPYCSFADARVFLLKYIWMISWSSLTHSVLAKRYESFVLSVGSYWILICLGLHVDFSNSRIHLTLHLS